MNDSVEFKNGGTSFMGPEGLGRFRLVVAPGTLSWDFPKCK